MINPTQRDCFRACTSCLRCSDKGKYAQCADCSGRHDPQCRIYPDPDNYCDCKNGIMRWKTKEGRLIIRKFLSNPFAANVTTDAETEDERDWNSYVEEKREQLDDATFDPVTFVGGKSTKDWVRDWKLGQ